VVSHLLFLVMLCLVLAVLLVMLAMVRMMMEDIAMTQARMMLMEELLRHRHRRLFDRTRARG